MIGVISNKSEQHIVEEFFEFFKTPWEFYREKRNYDVLLVTNEKIPEVNTKLVIIYRSGPSEWDLQNKIKIAPTLNNSSVLNEAAELPVFGRLSTVESAGPPLLQLKNNSRTVGQVIKKSASTFIRIGFDLFDEIEYLLTKGQPSERAHIPTLDIHISWLRDWIIAAGIPVVEIPPQPAGYNFFVCLTHDVDFVGIKQHKFDHTLWGFLYRALWDCSIKTLCGQMPLKSLYKNIKAVVSLPLIYLGLANDFWNQFDAYAEIEKDLKATYFLIPFKKRPGEQAGFDHWGRRATRYDILDVLPAIKKLARNGFEIGLHGIDSWHDKERARIELRRIASVTEQAKVGVRMHWLCFNQSSPIILDETGFYYDSTMGYNDTVGYFCGTTQAFRPLGAKKLLELPLHIQDTALLEGGLTKQGESKAWNSCKKLVENTTIYGGVLTLLWHLRSLAPERLYGGFYKDLLKLLKAHKACFLTARKAVQWFEFRRAVRFRQCCIDKESLRISLKRTGPARYPHLILRAHIPPSSKLKSLPGRAQVKDIIFSDETEIQIPLKETQFLPLNHRDKSHIFARI